MGGLKQRSKSVVKAMGDCFRLVVIEYQLRRELRRSLWEETKSIWGRPQLSEPSSIHRDFIVDGNLVGGARKHLHKEITHAHRRDLRVW
jgi:hypothetical protein